jgi:hypothetical protein
MAGKTDNARVGGDSTSIIFKNTTCKLLICALSFSTRGLNIMLIHYVLQEQHETLIYPWRRRNNNNIKRNLKGIK